MFNFVKSEIRNITAVMYGISAPRHYADQPTSWRKEQYGSDI